MRTQHQRITIIKLSKPVRCELNEEMKWLGSTLGLFNLRDRESSCYRIFIELLKSSRQDKELSSDNIAFRLHLSRGTVVHHLNKLIDSGIVVADRNRYLLRVGNLEILVDEIRKDVERAISDLKDVAKRIDAELEL